MELHSTFIAYGVSDYLSGLYGATRTGATAQFRHVCTAVERYVDEIITAEHAEGDHGTGIQRDALMGKPEAVRYFTGMVTRYLKERGLMDVEYPACYRTLVDAIYHEIWGYSVLAQWFNAGDWQAAKVIGDRVYYLVNQRQQLQPYTISAERREQLITTLLLNTPDKNRISKYVEMNLQTGERITIFNRNVTAEGQDVIVLRKYTVQRHTWEEQALRGTIHKPSVLLMKHLCRIGINVMFAGPVRSGKTTMLETWQSYEDPTLEGVIIEATDEIKIHELMPGAPIMSLVTNEEDVGDIVRPILRSDADYLVLAEARTGYEFDLGVRLANKGTNRCKTTMHTTRVGEMLFDITDEIMAVRPNARFETVLFRVASAYHYIVQLSQDYHDKSKKRVLGIYEVCVDRAGQKIWLQPICLYQGNGSWTWSNNIGNDKRELAKIESWDDFEKFESQLNMLADQYPMEGDNRIAVYGGLNG
jgi:pilus assembly protein CpaF